MFLTSSDSTVQGFSASSNRVNLYHLIVINQFYLPERNCHIFRRRSKAIILSPIARLHRMNNHFNLLGIVARNSFFSLSLSFCWGDKMHAFDLELCLPPSMPDRLKMASMGHIILYAPPYHRSFTPLGNIIHSKACTATVMKTSQN